MLTLYHCHNSYASQKVRLYLAERSIPWESHHIDLLKQEHITKEYVKINPRGLVPALDDDGKIILNSTDIMQYIEDHYVKDILIGADLSRQIYEFGKKDEDLHDPHIRTLSYHYLWMNREASPEEVDRVLTLAKKHPDRARGEFLARAIQRQITKEEVSRANEEIIVAIEDMERRLQASRSGFLFGDEYTIADAVGTARLFRLELLNFGDLIKQYPLISKYYATMIQRSSFVKANMKGSER